MISFLSHPSLGWLYIFSSFSPHSPPRLPPPPPPPPRPPRPPPQQLLPLTSTPFQLNLRYLAQRIYESGQMYWVTFRWPWPKVTAVASISKKLLVCAIKWEPLIGSLQNTAVFFQNIGHVFSRSNTILAISQEWLVRLMWNEKEVHRLDTGYNMWPWSLTSLMTLALDVSRSNFEIALSQELLVWLMWNENYVS